MALAPRVTPRLRCDRTGLHSPGREDARSTGGASSTATTESLTARRRSSRRHYVGLALTGLFLVLAVLPLTHDGGALLLASHARFGLYVLGVALVAIVAVELTDGGP